MSSRRRESSTCHEEQSILILLTHALELVPFGIPGRLLSNRIPDEHRRALATSYFSLDGPVPPGSVADLVRPSASAVARSARVPVCTQVRAASVSLVSIDHVASVAASSTAAAAETHDWSFWHRRRHGKHRQYRVRVPAHAEQVFPRFPYVAACRFRLHGGDGIARLAFIREMQG